MYKTTARAISGIGDGGLGSGGDSEEAGKWMAQEILRRDKFVNLGD